MWQVPVCQCDTVPAWESSSDRDIAWPGCTITSGLHAQTGGLTVLYCTVHRQTVLYIGRLYCTAVILPRPMPTLLCHLTFHISNFGHSVRPNLAPSDDFELTKIPNYIAVHSLQYSEPTIVQSLQYNMYSSVSHYSDIKYCTLCVVG